MVDSASVGTVVDVSFTVDVSMSGAVFFSLATGVTDSVDSADGSGSIDLVDFAVSVDFAESVGVDSVDSVSISDVGSSVAVFSASSPLWVSIQHAPIPNMSNDTAKIHKAVTPLIGRDFFFCVLEACAIPGEANPRSP